MRASIYGLLLVVLLAFASTAALAEQQAVAVHDEDELDLADMSEDEFDVADEDEVEVEDEQDVDDEDEDVVEDEEEADLEDEDEDDAADEQDDEADLEEESLAEVAVGAPTDITAAVLHKPGSPATYALAPYFYKVWGSADKAKADAMEATWNEAWAKYALPTPEHTVVEVKFAHPPVNGWAFRTKTAPGTFFQFSKGHKQAVIDWINTQTSKIELGRLRNCFDALNKHVGDGQGFFVPGTANILFIDINLKAGGTTPDAAAVVAAIDVRLTNAAVH